MSSLENARQTLLILSPELLMLLSATVMMTVGAFVRLPRRAWATTATVTLVASLLALIALRHTTNDLYASVAINDAMSGYGRLFFLLTGFLVLALAHDAVDDARASEFFGSLLMINAGAMLVVAANELVFLFVGLELVSIPTYLLLYLPRRTASTQEAATKYFFLSIFSSGLLLFGLAYLYGMTGVSNLKALSYLARITPTVPDVPHPVLGVIAVVFVMAGLGFRVAAVPFHFYAPDVYQGSPTFMAALLAWVPKGIGFVAILRTLTAVIPTDRFDSSLTTKAAVLAWIIAVVTMTLGNTVALAQTNLKRLFAYSSIAHAGYLMIGVAVAFRNGSMDVGSLRMMGSEAVLFYLVAYALMTLGAFAIIIGLSTPERPVEKVDDLNGLIRTHPVLAIAMAVCLFSLAGIPPLAGFFSKLYLFVSAFDAGRNEDARFYQYLALAGAINSAIGAYYYLKIVVAMYYKAPTGAPLAGKPSWPVALSIGACTTLTIVFGLYPNPITIATRDSAEALVNLPAPTAPAPVAEVPVVVTAVPAAR
ncbi:NADH-quinone oxidoreductase subunit N [Tundrisphaera sp. TA3]|uniref:NADH-quinone oxidoreductase subunit N n=1 Tax=Tundrisphaera sp. TA3 TaxID=3435775 RepID=UPI003EB82A68